MKNDNIYLHNMRLNLDNPDHLALHRCLMNVDTSLFRSKNEFLIKAAMAGVEVMNEDLAKVLREQEVKLSEEQFNRLGTKVAGLLKAEVMNEVLKTLLGMVVGQAKPLVQPKQEEKKKENEVEDYIADAAMDYFEE